MANRNNRPMGNRRMDFNRGKGLLPRPMPQVSPWQQGGSPMNSMLPLGNTSEATLVLANNLINNLLQARQNPMPSLLDVPVQRNFPPPDFNRGPVRMGNQPNFRRGPGNFSGPMGPPRPNNRNNKNFRPLDNKRQPNNQRRDEPKFKNKQSPSPKKAEPKTAKAEVKEEFFADNDVPMETTEAPVEEQEKEATDNSAEPEKVDKVDKVEKTPKKDDGQKTPFDNIDPAFLHCHICNKMMWDGRSFENHVNGRAHHMMMEKTAESYALTADTIRQELKIREMKFHRRQGKPVSRRFFCPMCDLYAADGATHRTSLGHRKLKKFLHPACSVCGMEMPTRIDLDQHKLSVEHMKMLSSKRGTNYKLKPHNITIATFAEEEGFVRTDRRGRKPRTDTEKSGDKSVDQSADKSADQSADKAVDQSTDKSVDQSADKSVDQSGDKSEEQKAEVKEEGEGEEDEDDVVLDVWEGMDLASLAEKKPPTYLPHRGVGASFVKEMKLYECSLCNKYLDSEETAEVHLRTWRHHTLFVKHVNKLKKNEGEGTKRGSEGQDEESETKRLKTDEAETANGLDDKEGDESMEGAEQEGEGQNGGEPEDGSQWEREIDELINDIPDAEQEEKPASPPKVEAPPPAATPSKRGRGRGRGRGARRY